MLNVFFLIVVIIQQYLLFITDSLQKYYNFCASYERGITHYSILWITKVNYKHGWNERNKIALIHN